MIFDSCFRHDFDTKYPFRVIQIILAEEYNCGHRKERREMKKRISQKVLKDNFELGVLALPTIILLALFSYWPMFGTILAFKDYKVTEGIFGSPWAQPLFKNFDFFLKSQDAWRVTRNTIGLNLMFIVVGTTCSVIFALLMYEVKKRSHVKAYQTISILPRFLSWVAVGYIVYGLLADDGLINGVLTALGREPVSWYGDAGLWPAILMIVRLWHGVGIGSIMYYAALMGIDSELFEAAKLDGASKFQQIIYISLPHLVSIITIMVIMDIGRIFRADFGMFYNVPRNVGLLYETTEVMDTYVYKALLKHGNIPMSSAASFIQSIVCFITIIVTNGVVKKIEPDNALF